MRILFSGVSGVLCLALTSVADAGPSPWQRVTRPSATLAQVRYAQADSKRTPADPFKQGPEQELLLNELCAQALLLGGVEQLGDAGLQYLFADCLSRAPGQYQTQARQAWQRALEQAPEHPQAAQAWLNIGLQSETLDEPQVALHAYTKALQSEWDEETRAGLYRVRAQVRMGLGDLKGATADYWVAFAEGNSLETRTLAQWGLAVAFDRAYDHPSALRYALSASQARFGNAGRTSVLDLDESWLSPLEERHYYRALGLMAQAHADPRAAGRVATLQAAQLMWLQYLDDAPPRGRWVPRAREHLERIRRVLGSDDD
jgi:hypothetical protein